MAQSGSHTSKVRELLAINARVRRESDDSWDRDAEQAEMIKLSYIPCFSMLRLLQNFKDGPRLSAGIKSENFPYWSWRSEASADNGHVTTS